MYNRVVNHADTTGGAEIGIESLDFQVDDAILRHSDRKPAFDPGIGEGAVVAQESTVSPHTLFSFATCKLKGAYHMQRVTQVGLSKFAERFVRDGQSFENTLIQNLSKWLPKFNELFKTNLNAEELTVTQCNKNDADKTLRPVSEEALACSTKHIIEASKRPYPAILTQVSLRIDRVQAKQLFGFDKTLQGVVDLAIWTGSRWVLGDIKRTETALIQYCIQVEFYCRMWEVLFSSAVLDKHGFLVTCSPGFVYSESETKKSRATALENVLVEKLERELIEPSFQENLALAGNFCGKVNLRDRVFNLSCVECGFRHKCYADMFAQPGNDIGFLPLSEAHLVRLRSEGVNTVEELIQKGTNYEVLQDICINDQSAELWLKRARIVTILGGYCSWRPLPIWSSNFWVAALSSEEPQGERKLGWTTHAMTDFYAEVPAEPYPAVIFTYTQAEKRWVQAEWSKAREHRPDMPKLPTIVVLQDEVREHVRFPLTSFTLDATGVLLREVADGKHSKAVVMAWVDKANIAINSKSKKFPDETIFTKRVIGVWYLVDALFRISRRCQEEEYYAPVI